jgi:hypothetical protein
LLNNNDNLFIFAARRQPPQQQQGSGNCRVSNYLADGDASTWAFAEFSSKWRMGFSHLRGGSYNRTVVHKLLPEYESPVRN